MRFLALFLSAFSALFWIFHGLRVAIDSFRLPWLKDCAPAADADCPPISLLFAARDEQEKLPQALVTLAAIDYPNLEIIAVNDRSEDATGRILDDFAAAHPRFRAVHVAELPAGWLGKPHALQKGYENSSGEWLLFTDADVRFAPDALRRSITMVKRRQVDHLTLFGDVEMRGFWEKVLLTFFGMSFHLAADPHRVSKPHSNAYVGVGAFQLLRRTAYQTAGTHKRLAMEVVDDMKLGRIVKLAGFRSGVGVAQDAVVVRWHAGLGNLIRGVTKNFFAGTGYSVPKVIGSVTALWIVNVVPFAMLVFGHGWSRALAGVSVAIAVGFHAAVDIVMRVSPLYALTHPVGAILFGYMLLRSTAVTLWNGGVTWRGTFYALEELKRGKV